MMIIRWRASARSRVLDRAPTGHDDERSGLKTMRRYLLAHTILVLGAACTKGDENGLPPIDAASKYIDYSTYGEPWTICMDDLLAREDRFIEQTAVFLDVPAPTGRIRYIHEPDQDFGDPDTWACPDSMACYSYDEENDHGLILSGGYSHHHELVHAVEIPALGKDVHRVLAEGIAEYLGSSNSSEPVLQGFPVAFKAMLANPAKPSDYRLAMHFVGSLVERYGLAQYKSLRALVPADGGVNELGSAITSVYGKALDDLLADMSATPIHGLDVEPGCREGDGRVLAWTAPGLLEATLRGQCGDGWFVGGGSSYGTFYVIDVPESGVYEMTIDGPNAAMSLPAASLLACPDASPSGTSSPVGSARVGTLQSGRHILTIGFPPSPEPKGEATFRLELLFKVPP